MYARMIPMFSYLTGILEPEDKRALKRYGFLSVVLPVIELFSISMILPLVRQAVNATQASARFFAMTMGMNVLLVAKGGLELYKMRILNYLGNRCARKFSLKLYELLIKEDLSQHNRRGATQSLTMIRSDSVACMNLLITGLDIVSAGLVLAGFAAVLIAITGLVGLVSLMGFLGCMMLVHAFTHKNMLLHGEERRKQEIQLNGQITVTYGLFKTLKLDRRWRAAVKRYEDYSMRLAQIQEDYALKNTVVSIFLHNGILAAVFFLLALSMVLKIHLTEVLGEIIVFITLLLRMIPMGNSIVKNLHNMEFGRKSYESLRTGMEELECIHQKEREEQALREKKITFTDRLRIQGLTFAYRENENIFTDASLDLPVGKTIAIIGPSGSGKTTFVDLILGLLTPQSGSICYDDYDIVTGTDDKGRCRGELGNIISYIPQTVYLNGETVRNNVAFFSEEVDEERVRESLAAAQLLDDVEKLPNGLDSLIGERGATISGGQRQRLAVARALYKDFELLVMDEATAGLDRETEKAVLDAIRKLKHNKTLLIVTHHMGLVRECDLVYQIKDQKLVKVEMAEAGQG
ncbi:MAG: ABC transporter ATP-binding protein [Lachnospiraceae bacterium]|nr:ABC transporter ATP-binding protein [Lachnospiraceae bacterium]